MVTVSHLVKAQISSKPMLQEFLARGLVNYAALAEDLQPIIEKTLGKKVKISAIVMSLRRYEETIDNKQPRIQKVIKGASMSIKTGLADISTARTAQLYDDIGKLYKIVDYKRGDTLNIIHGNHEVSIIVDEKHVEKIQTLVKSGSVTKKLISLSISLNPDYVKTPGVIFSLLRHLAWENINIYELISTTSEISFILKEQDAMRAYNALREII